jgi:hypothetical protein
LILVFLGFCFGNPSKSGQGKFEHNTVINTELITLPACTKEVEALECETILLFGFIAPEAFVAASKQAVARDLKCSLEELTLKVTVDDKTKKKNCFTFKSLHLFGAGWEGDQLCIDDSIMFKLPLTRFTWITKAEAKKDKNQYLKSPVYLDESREKFLFEVELKAPTHIPLEVWSKRGVCICVW